MIEKTTNSNLNAITCNLIENLRFILHEIQFPESHLTNVDGSLTHKSKNNYKVPLFLSYRYNADPYAEIHTRVY